MGHQPASLSIVAASRTLLHFTYAGFHEKNGRYLIRDAEGLIRSFGAIREPI